MDSLPYSCSSFSGYSPWRVSVGITSCGAFWRCVVPYDKLQPFRSWWHRCYAAAGAWRRPVAEWCPLPSMHSVMLTTPPSWLVTCLVFLLEALLKRLTNPFSSVITLNKVMYLAACKLARDHIRYTDIYCRLLFFSTEKSLNKGTESVNPIDRTFHDFKRATKRTLLLSIIYTGSLIGILIMFF